MPLRNRRFLRSLYEQHLEEISILYARRRGFFDDPEVDVADVFDLEERTEAHLDALVIGGNAALETCVVRAEEGDPGEFFAAVSIFCRQGRPDLLEAALARFPEDEQDAEEEAHDDEPTLAEALCDALRFEGPEAWKPVYERMLIPEDMLATGLSGDPKAAPKLLEHLEAGVHPEMAAQALYLLTGAPLFETVTVEDEHEPPHGASDEPSDEPKAGREVLRPSRDAAAWREWWTEHGKSLEPGRRYRLGQLATPSVLASTLLHFVLPRSTRDLVAEGELR